MSYAEYLRELLRPLGVYDLGAPFNSAELDAAGQGLDAVAQQLELLWRESLLTTAQSWGLEQIAALFTRRPVTEDPRSLGAALTALLRIGGDSFTLDAINDTIIGCGIPARVSESGVGKVSVSFPHVVGKPASFIKLKKIIEDILPPHLAINYVFWYLTWIELERKFSSWNAIEQQALSWAGLEDYVD